MAERREWSRLPLAIPIFVRARMDGKEFLEFATALNVSAGGMLVAVRHALTPEEEVSVEIPIASVSTASSLPKAIRILRARVQRTGHVEAYNLVGLKFARPLIESFLRVRTGAPRRRQASMI